MRVRAFLAIAGWLCLSLPLVSQTDDAVVWLSKNAASADFSARLLAYMGAEPDLAKARALLADYGRFVKDPAVLRALYSLDAELAELSGAYAAAALSWERAGFADPRIRESAPFLAASRCALSSGDGERAANDARTAKLLASGPDERGLAEAYLAWGLAISGETSGALVLARAIAETGTGRAKLLGLWLVIACGDESAAASARKSVASDFPASPDARVLSGNLDIAAAPLWFIAFIDRTRTSATPFPASSSTASSSAAIPASAAATTPATTSASTAPSATGLEKTPAPATGPSTTPSSPTPSKSADAPAFFQIGAFGSEPNAQRLVSELSSKGFSATIRVKTAKSGTVLYLVLVPLRGDPEKMKMSLKNSGYEAYPVFE